MSYKLACLSLTCSAAFLVVCVLTSLGKFSDWFTPSSHPVSLSPPPPPLLPTTTLETEFSFESTVEEFDESRQREFLNNLGDYLGIDPQYMTIVDISSGSIIVRVQIEVPVSEETQLFEKIENTNRNKYNIRKHWKHYRACPYSFPMLCYFHMCFLFVFSMFFYFLWP